MFFEVFELAKKKKKKILVFWVFLILQKLKFMSEDEQSIISSLDRLEGETTGNGENDQSKNEINDWKGRVLSVKLQAEARLAELQSHLDGRTSLQIEKERLEEELKSQADSVIRLWREISHLQRVI